MNAIIRQSEQQTNIIQLVISAQRGDRRAMGELFARFEAVVYAIAMKRLRDHADAEELTQDVFVQAMQKIDQLRAPECFPGWLRSIAVRMSINRATRRAPCIASEPEIFEATLADSLTPVDRAMAREDSDQLRAGLRRLGEMDRDTLVAFYMNGQSLNEMSDDFDAPIGTIKRRLHVARKRLAKEVDEMAGAAR